MGKTVLAIDPGTAKCGVALVSRSDGGETKLLFHCMTVPDEIAVALRQACAVESVNTVVIGSGTGSKDIVKRIRDEFPGFAVLIVDEKDTTTQARERYWEHNLRTGWRRFLPSSLQVPPEPFDDYAALILAERVLSQG